MAGNDPDPFFDKKGITEWLLENGEELKIEDIESIYGSGTYMADGKHWKDIEQIFSRHEYHKIKSLPKLIIWGEDDPEDRRIIAYIYLIIFKNRRTQIIVERLQNSIYVEPYNYTPARIVIKENINPEDVKYFNVQYRIYPYKII